MSRPSEEAAALALVVAAGSFVQQHHWPAALFSSAVAWAVVYLVGRGRVLTQAGG